MQVDADADASISISGQQKLNCEFTSFTYYDGQSSIQISQNHQSSYAICIYSNCCPPDTARDTCYATMTNFSVTSTLFSLTNDNAHASNTIRTLFPPPVETRMQTRTLSLFRPLFQFYPCHFSTAFSKRPSFVFDIDGVLLRGKIPLPPARAALNHLFDAQRQRWRTPVAFLTNSGGHTEFTRANILSSLFNLPISADQIVLSHTPLRRLAPHYNGMGGAIITVGPPTCVHAAREYGYKNVLSAERLSLVRPEATPFAKMDHLDPVTEEELVLATMPVSAIFVMADSRDWGRDIQLMIDILASDGSFERRVSEEQVVDLYFCNPDITFPNEYTMPRLAGGSFRVALEAVFEKVTGRKLSCIQLGKPFAKNYEAAEGVLRAQARQLGLGEGGGVERVYAVGDNPMSDVRGANRWGRGWVSVLVRTGNFQGVNSEHDVAKVVCDDVYEAVKFGLEKTGIESDDPSLTG